MKIENWFWGYLNDRFKISNKIPKIGKKLLDNYFLIFSFLKKSMKIILLSFPNSPASFFRFLVFQTAECPCMVLAIPWTKTDLVKVKPHILPAQIWPNHFPQCPLIWCRLSRRGWPEFLRQTWSSHFSTMPSLSTQIDLAK